MMDNLLIKRGEKKVALEESTERKRSWRMERFTASTPSPRSLATRPAHTAFQFKQGKKYFVCVACKRTFGSKQALSRHRQQQHTALGKRCFKFPACTYTGIRHGEVVNRHIRNRHPHLVGKISPPRLGSLCPYISRKGCWRCHSSTRNIQPVAGRGSTKVSPIPSRRTALPLLPSSPGNQEISRDHGHRTKNNKLHCHFPFRSRPIPLHCSHLPTDENQGLM